MPKVLSEAQVAAYRRDGFHFPVRAMSAAEARSYRDRLEAWERASGGPIAGNRRHKVHLLFTWADALIRHPAILDAVEDVLGPNLLCWNANFFIKDSGSDDFVTWHQDATYWGLSDDAVCTAWLALSEVPVETGPMRFWPGSHAMDQLPHADTFHEHNLLSRGQEVAVAVPEEEAVTAPLAAGEISLHHVKLVHGSVPNRGADRRVGLAIRYVAPHVAQLKTADSATLVRGVDEYGHFAPERAPAADMDEAAVAAHAEAMARQVAALYEGTGKTEFRA